MREKQKNGDFECVCDCASGGIACCHHICAAYVCGGVSFATGWGYCCYYYIADRKGVCQFANSKQFSEHGSHWLLAQNYGQFASLGEATVGQEVVIKSGDVESTYQITYSGVGTVTDDYSTVVDSDDKPLLRLDDIEDVLYMYTSYPFDSLDISMQRYVVVGRLISQRVV